MGIRAGRTATAAMALILAWLPAGMAQTANRNITGENANWIRFPVPGGKPEHHRTGHL